MESWLSKKKRSKGFHLTNYTKRWFKLEGFYLAYYDNEKNKRSRESFDLRNCHLVRATSKTDFSIQLEDPSQVIELKAGSESLMTTWLVLLTPFTVWKPGRSNFSIPRLVKAAVLSGISHLDEHGARTKNLFSIGNMTKYTQEVKLLVLKLLGGASKVEKKEKPAVVACLLQSLLLSLPEPLLTNKLIDSFIEAGDKKNDNDELRLLLDALPSENKDIITAFGTFLTRHGKEAREGLKELANSVKHLFTGKESHPLNSSMLTLIPAICKTVTSKPSKTQAKYGEIIRSASFRGAVDTYGSNRGVKKDNKSPFQPKLAKQREAPQSESETDEDNEFLKRRKQLSVKKQPKKKAEKAAEPSKSSASLDLSGMFGDDNSLDLDSDEEDKKKKDKQAALVRKARVKMEKAKLARDKADKAAEKKQKKKRERRPVRTPSPSSRSSRRDNTMDELGLGTGPRADSEDMLSDYDYLPTPPPPKEKDAKKKKQKRGDESSDWDEESAEEDKQQRQEKEEEQEDDDPLMSLYDDDKPKKEARKGRFKVVQGGEKGGKNSRPGTANSFDSRNDSYSYSDASRPTTGYSRPGTGRPDTASSFDSRPTTAASRKGKEEEGGGEEKRTKKKAEQEAANDWDNSGSDSDSNFDDDEEEEDSWENSDEEDSWEKSESESESEKEDDWDDDSDGGDDDSDWDGGGGLKKDKKMAEKEAAKVDKLEKAAGDAKSLIKDLKDQLKDLKQQLKEKKKEAKEKNKEIKDCKKEAKKRDKERRKAVEKEKKIGKKKDKLEAKCELLNNKLDRKEKTLEGREMKILEHVNKYKEKVNELQQERNRAAELEAKARLGDESLAELTRAKIVLTTELEDLKADKQELEHQVDSMSHQRDIAREDSRRADAQNLELATRMDGLKNSHMDKLSQLNADIAKVMAENDALLSQLKQQERDMSLKMDEARDHAKQEALVAFEEREDELRAQNIKLLEKRQVEMASEMSAEKGKAMSAYHQRDEMLRRSELTQREQQETMGLLNSLRLRLKNSEEERHMQLLSHETTASLAQSRYNQLRAELAAVRQELDNKETDTEREMRQLKEQRDEAKFEKSQLQAKLASAEERSEILKEQVIKLRVTTEAEVLRTETERDLRMLRERSELEHNDAQLSQKILFYQQQEKQHRQRVKDLNEAKLNLEKRLMDALSVNARLETEQKRLSHKVRYLDKSVDNIERMRRSNLRAQGDMMKMKDSAISQLHKTIASDREAMQQAHRTRLREQQREQDEERLRQNRLFQAKLMKNLHDDASKPFGGWLAAGKENQTAASSSQASRPSVLAMSSQHQPQQQLDKLGAVAKHDLSESRRRLELLGHSLMHS